MGDNDPLPKRDLKLINLLKGWPNPSLLPTTAISTASQTALSTPSIAIPALCYGPDPGYQPLREEIARWLSAFYSSPSSPTSPSLVRSSSSPPPPPQQLGSGVSEFSPATTTDPADRICITGGASQNLACVLQVFTDPVVTRVWMVAPCYFLACRIFEDAGLRLGAVPEKDEENGGLDLEWLERGMLEAEREDDGVKPLKAPKPWSKIYKHVIYLVPTFSNPTGKTLSVPHRLALLSLARRHDALIITDDVYDFLRWPTPPASSSPSPSSSPLPPPLPTLTQLDALSLPPSSTSFGNALSNGSFSKIVGPGVRTGWAEASPRLIYGLSQCGSSRSGGAPSQLVATMMCELLRSGALKEHIEGTLVPAYQRRHGAMIEAVGRVLVPLGVTCGDPCQTANEEFYGGYFIWLTLPPSILAKQIVEHAMARYNLVVSPGYAFEVNGDERVKFAHQIRLCFAWEEEGDLVEGIERLGATIKDIIDEKDSDGLRADSMTEKKEGKDLSAFQ